MEAGTVGGETVRECFQCEAELAAQAASCPTCGPSRRVPTTDLTVPLLPRGTVVAGRFEVERLLGNGGMAIVYLVVDLQHDRQPYAVKLPADVVAQDEEAHKRFMREAERHLDLSHPHIVKLFFDLEAPLFGGRGRGHPFLVMEYLPGPSLARVLLDRFDARLPERLTVDEVARILPGIAAAVDHAHERGIIHQHLEPANVLLSGPIDQEGVVAKLSDFGIAAQLRRTMTRLMTGRSPGTPPYVAPEQVLNRGVGSASDIYGLAATVYHLLAGEPPLGGEDIFQKIEKVMPSPIPGVPPGVNEVVLRGLAKDPSERHGSGAEMADAFSKAARAQPSRPRPAQVPPTRDDAGLGEPPAGTRPEDHRVSPGPPAATSEHGTPLPASSRPSARREARWLAAGVVASLLAVALYWDDLPWPTGRHTTIRAAAVVSGAGPTATLTTTPIPVGPTIVSRRFAPDDAEMVLVAAGEFLMGTEGDSGDESPQHRVYVDAFYLDKHEVSNARFGRFAKATGYRTEAEKQGHSQGWVERKWGRVDGASWRQPHGPGSEPDPRHPVVHVSWNDAQEYCRWAGKRLPTEAEWEKAARGTDGREYPWGNEGPTGRHANFADRCARSMGVSSAVEDQDDGHEYTAAVGSFALGASPYGCGDMGGNVWEWCADWFEARYYADSPARNPSGPESGSGRVLRGGSWYHDASLLRCAYRYNRHPARRYDEVGFRGARSLR